MGMAASQARLLTLTARLHDVEYEAQSIQQAKLQLATQQDAAYEDYQRALDATSFTFTAMDSSGTQSTIVANFNNLFSVNGANIASGHNYALINDRGLVVVSDYIEQGYDAFTHSEYTQNAYNFAMYMLYGDDFENAQPEDPAGVFLQAILDKILEHLPQSPEDEGDSVLTNMIQSIFGPGNEIDLDSIRNIINPDANTDPEQCGALLNYFFRTYGTQMFNEMEMPDEKLTEFNYYVRMFNAIQQHGGCISITHYDGPDGSAANNSEWLTNMLQSGQFTIQMFDNDNQLHGTSVADDTALHYTTTTQIDRVALAKAEAKYEHELKLIDRKDKKFDMDLNKLETERSALTKQYDSIKKVVDDNIERTFGIFS